MNQNLKKYWQRFGEMDFGNHFMVAAWCFIVLGLVIVAAALHQSDIGSPMSFGSKFENLPNYLVFIATAISACLLYVTLTAIRKANKKQQQATEIAAFENRFLEMIKIYRDNVQEMEYSIENNGAVDKMKGRQVFLVFHYQFIALFDDLKKALKDENITESDLM